jgi:hypothetical protein
MPFRGRLGRLVVSVQVALLLTVQIMDGSGIQHCPHHDRGAGAVPAGAQVVAVHHHHQDSDQPHQHQGSCTCLGPCHGVTHLLAVGVAPAGIPVSGTVTRTVAAPLLLELRSPVPHLLPFALGPPPPA